MHMLLVIVAGVLLLGVFALFGKLWGGDVAGIALAAQYFLPVWLLVALTNAWVGVTKAGYSVSEELPVLLVVFLIPAAIAGFAAWQLLKS